MKICDFNNEYLIPLLAKILQGEKTCLLMGDFNINLLNTDTDHNVSDFYDILSILFYQLFQFFCSLFSNFFAPYILQQTRLTKDSKTLTDNIFFKFN